MSTKVEINSAKSIMNRIGIIPGGKVFSYFMSETEKNLTKYLPYRDNGSFIDAITNGRSDKNGEWVFDLPYARKLYYGKAMSGKDINYTKDVHTEAGPFWDKQVMSNDISKIATSLQKFINSGVAR